MRGFDIKIIRDRCRKCDFTEIICWVGTAFGIGLLLAIMCPVRFALVLAAVAIIAMGALVCC